MSSQRPFKDWPIVKFLTKKIPNVAVEAASGLAEVAMGKSPVAVIRDKLRGEIESDRSLSDDDKEMLLAQLESDLKMAEIEAKDRDSARQAEIARLQATGGKGFIGKFTYILAICLFIGAFLMLGIITFVEIPEGNRTLFNVSFGYIWGGFSTVIAYYFGDSERVKKQEELIKKVAKG